jgi:hypothetical protein
VHNEEERKKKFEQNTVHTKEHAPLLLLLPEVRTLLRMYLRHDPAAVPMIRSDGGAGRRGGGGGGPWAGGFPEPLEGDAPDERI